MGDIRRIVVVMDPPQQVQPAKDSTVALMLAAQRRGIEISITTPTEIAASATDVHAPARRIRVADQADWYHVEAAGRVSLLEADVVLMRKDPPVDMTYIATTWLLDRVVAAEVSVLNAPQALRDINEKLSIGLFADLAPPFLVSARLAELEAFLSEYNEIVIKPLDRMGGASVHRLRQGEPSRAAIMEAVTAHETMPVMAQPFLPAVLDGDRRLLIIDGELIPHVAVRTPKAGDFRANLAQGGTLRVEPATESDCAIAARLGATLRAAGICFAGVDVIGGRLTEINITSPTCIREVEAASGEDVSGRFWDAVTDGWLGGVVSCAI